VGNLNYITLMGVITELFATTMGTGKSRHLWANAQYCRFLQKTQRLMGWLSQVKALFEQFVPVADANPLGDTFFDQV